MQSNVTAIWRDNLRVLIVDHDSDTLCALAEYLSDYEFMTDMAANLTEMQSILDTTAIDLVILDGRLPGENGLDVCKRLAGPGGPAIILTSDMADETDRIVGLELGADDYLPKPVCMRELLARVRAVLRPRRSIYCADEGRRGAYEFAGWRLDLARRELTSPEGQLVRLPRSDLALLRVFLDQPMRPLTRDQLLFLSQGSSGDRGIDVQVSRLRQKLENAAPGQQLITTVRRLGYLFNAQVRVDRHTACVGAIPTH
jgi:two-component system OmpR family response regulator